MMTPITLSDILEDDLAMPSLAHKTEPFTMNHVAEKEPSPKEYTNRKFNTQLR